MLSVTNSVMPRHRSFKTRQDRDMNLSRQDQDTRHQFSESPRQDQDQDINLSRQDQDTRHHFSESPRQDQDTRHN